MGPLPSSVRPWLSAPFSRGPQNRAGGSKRPWAYGLQVPRVGVLWGALAQVQPDGEPRNANRVFPQNGGISGGAPWKAPV